MISKISFLLFLLLILFIIYLTGDSLLDKILQLEKENTFSKETYPNITHFAPIGGYHIGRLYGYIFCYSIIILLISAFVITWRRGFFLALTSLSIISIFWCIYLQYYLYSRIGLYSVKLLLIVVLIISVCVLFYFSHGFKKVILKFKKADFFHLVFLGLLEFCAYYYVENVL